MEINNKVFVVSGASSGLGAATVEHLIQKGGRVIALDIQPLNKEVLASSDSVLFTRCDIADAEMVQQSIHFGYESFGEIHGAIACAGIAPANLMHSSTRGSHPEDIFLRTIHINLVGTFHLFNSVVPYIKPQEPINEEGEKGILVATSSVAAAEGQVGQAAYAASKGGVASIVLPMARELARAGIRVNAIAPGVFRTPMMEGFSEEVRTALENKVPFPRRLGKPKEFAMLVEHIIINSYINGTVIRLDGGIRLE